MSRARTGIVDALKYLSLIVGALVVLFPPFFVVINAFKTDQEYYSQSPYQLPAHWAFSNLGLVWNMGALGNAFFNTLFIMFFSVLGNIIIGTMVAYVLSRFEFRLKKIILGAYVVVLFIPMITTQVATFSVIKNLGLFDTRWAAILLYMGTDVVQIYIYQQFIRNIPVSLDESALLDGASFFRIYRSIIFPLLTPATATVVILKTISIYNDMFIPWLYMPDDNLGVVSTSLMRFAGPETAHWNLICAAVLVIAIPTVVLFLILQRYIFAGVVNGAIKE